MFEYVASHKLLIGQWDKNVVDRMNANLHGILIELEQTTKGTKVTNVGGWHGEYTFHMSPHARVLNNHIKTAVSELRKHRELKEDLEIFTMWGNVSRQGHYMNPHKHSGVLSGFYCVDPGNPQIEQSGVTRILADVDRCPWKVKERPDNADKLVNEYTLVPVAGQIVLFPSETIHYVEPYDGTEPRVTVAFNLK